MADKRTDYPSALPGLEDPKIGHGHAGRVQEAVQASIDAANLPPLDRGAGALAVELARAVDVGSRRNDPFAVAQAAGPLREQLVRLKLDPASRQDSADDFARWLDSLDSDPTDDGAAALAHPQDPGT